MADKTVATTNLSGSLLSLIIFGFYVLLFIITVQAVLQRKNRTRKSYLVVTVLVVLFLMNAIDAAYTLGSIYDAFIIWPGGAADYYENASGDAVFLAFDEYTLNAAYHTPSETLFSWAYVGASVAADSLLLWRLWVIWTSNKLVIVFPALGLLLNFIGAWVIFALDIVTSGPSDTPKLDHSILVWEYLILANTVAINVYMTFFISLKLWRMSKSIKKFCGRIDHPYNRIIGALVESGTLYTSVYLANLITLLLKHSNRDLPGVAATQIIISYLNIRTAGIMPTLIVLYVNTAGWRLEQRDVTHTSGSMPVFTNTTIVSPVTDSQGHAHFLGSKPFALSSPKPNKERGTLRQSRFGVSQDLESLRDNFSVSVDQSSKGCSPEAEKAQTPMLDMTTIMEPSLEYSAPTEVVQSTIPSPLTR